MIGGRCHDRAHDCSDDRNRRSRGFADVEAGQELVGGTGVYDKRTTVSPGTDRSAPDVAPVRPRERGETGPPVRVAGPLPLPFARPRRLLPPFLLYTRHIPPYLLVTIDSICTHPFSPETA